MDLFFQGSFGDQHKNLDHLFLPHPMHPGGGRLLPGRIPPAIIINDGLGNDQIDAEAAGQQAGTEDPAVRIGVDVSIILWRLPSVILPLIPANSILDRRR